jgi:hypothetical protein
MDRKRVKSTILEDSRRKGQTAASATDTGHTGDPRSHPDSAKQPSRTIRTRRRDLQLANRVSRVRGRRRCWISKKYAIDEFSEWVPRTPSISRGSQLDSARSECKELDSPPPPPPRGGESGSDNMCQSG